MKSDQVITLSQLDSISDPSNTGKKSIIWKEFGNYIDRKVDIKPNTSNTSGGPSLSTNLVYKICNSCERPIGVQSLQSHYLKCVEMKQQEQETKSKSKKRTFAEVDYSSLDENNTPAPPQPISVGNDEGETKPKKKYKKSQAQKEKEAANAAAAAAAAAASNTHPEKQTKKKKLTAVKEQVKPKPVAKPKGPVDVEKQCGVALPSGGLCARSLTCKTHSMGAKRAVPGRSAPYDVLLQQYQKRNQAKIAQSNALAAQRRENAAFNDEMESNNNSSKILDPDDETHLVLEGLSKNNPMPLERKIVMPVRYRHRFLQQREFYANALIISPHNSQQQREQREQQQQSGDSTLANQAISGSIGGLQGRCALINVDAQPLPNSDSKTQAFSAIPGEIYQVRAPSKAILLTAQHNNMQQQAFQQQLLKFQQQQQQLMRQRQEQAK